MKMRKRKKLRAQKYRVKAPSFIQFLKAFIKRIPDILNAWVNTLKETSKNLKGAKK